MFRNALSTFAFSLIATASFASLNVEAAKPRTFSGTVMKISDGDTIRFLPDGAAEGTSPWSIRMMSEDTAELHLPTAGGIQSQGYWGEEGKAQLESIVAIGDKVEVDSYGLDAYGRVLGKIYKGKSEVNYEMVRSGWGALYIICDDTSCDLKPEYRLACQQALKGGLGIFNPARPLKEMPFLFRSRLQKRPLGKFVASQKTGKYYLPGDYKRVNICDRVFFLSEAAAQAQGFVPGF